MQSQSFRGADVKEALSRVRASLGPDALIQSTRQVTNGRGGALGHAWVEVTATAPAGRHSWQFEPNGKPTVVSPPRFSSLRSPPTERAPRPGMSRMGRTPTLGLDASELERELLTLRAMLDELNQSRPPRERVMSLLAAFGVEGALARQLATGAGRVARRGSDALQSWLVQRIAERVTLAPDPLVAPGQQIIVAVGNTGVGKTTTLAKLAARARLDLGRSVCVFSFDTYRVGAVEQWQRYASLMGIPFHALSSPDELSRRLSERSADIVLVDTTGKTASSPPEDWPLAESLDSLAGRNLHTLLVMPAWMRGRDAERTCTLYRDARPTGVVVSKLDETCQPGGVLHAAIPNALPLTYFCNGPRVPEDIHLASIEALVSGNPLGCS
ncbi:MAG: flagellar biosynthesis protein FlhF [Myxococcales bacterium]|nr:flagellar biosynthesis protein FlhF [Myxococcales bacterium]